MLVLLVTPDGTSAKMPAEASKALATLDSPGSFLKVYRERYRERPLPPDPTPTTAESASGSPRADSSAVSDS